MCVFRLRSVLVNVCAYASAARAACLRSVTPPAIRSSAQQIRRASVLAGCRSRTRRWSTKQIEWDRKVGHRHKIKQWVYFQNKKKWVCSAYCISLCHDNNSSVFIQIPLWIEIEIIYFPHCRSAKIAHIFHHLKLCFILNFEFWKFLTYSWKIQTTHSSPSFSFFGPKVLRRSPRKIGQKLCIQPLWQWMRPNLKQRAHKYSTPSMILISQSVRCHLAFLCTDESTRLLMIWRLASFGKQSSCVSSSSSS